MKETGFGFRRKMIPGRISIDTCLDDLRLVLGTLAMVLM